MYIIFMYPFVNGCISKIRLSSSYSPLPMKISQLVILILIIQICNSCKQEQVVTLNECVCSSIDYKYRRSNFSIVDTSKVKNLKNELNKLRVIDDDGRIIFGDTLILNCNNGKHLQIEVNEDYIKLNDQKYHPQKSTSKLIRHYKGDARRTRAIQNALSDIESTKSLSLRDCNISKIPKEIFRLINLEYLDLSLNTIDTIPAEISNLKMLKELSISYNLLRNISPEISKLENIERIWFLDNNLNLIPDEICELKNLKELNLNGNKLEELPICIPNMESLERVFVGTFEEKDQSKKVLKQIEEFKKINENLNIRG